MFKGSCYRQEIFLVAKPRDLFFQCDAWIIIYSNASKAIGSTIPKFTFFYGWYKPSIHMGSSSVSDLYTIYPNKNQRRSNKFLLLKSPT
jgi:hypothetical protein